MGHVYCSEVSEQSSTQADTLNEWIASSLLAKPTIATPKMALVNISAEFLARCPDFHIQLATKAPGGRTGPTFWIVASGEAQ